LEVRQLLEQYGAYTPVVEPEPEPLPEVPEEPVMTEEPVAEDYRDVEFQQYLEAGVSAFNAGSYEEAKSYLEAAAELKPEDVSVHYYLSDAYYALGEIDAAMVEIEKARELLE